MAHNRSDYISFQAFRLKSAKGPVGIYAGSPTPLMLLYQLGSFPNQYVISVSLQGAVLLAYRAFNMGMGTPTVSDIFVYAA